MWNGYYYALIGRVEQIPEIFGEHRLSAVNYLAPGRPMMEMIENQVYLAQGAYVKVIGKSEGILAVCQGLHYALVALHVQIQTAAAYEKMGKHGEARAILKQALSDAAKDNMVIPFAATPPSPMKWRRSSPSARSSKASRKKTSLPPRLSLIHI